MMKSHFWGTALLGVLLLNAVVAAALSLQYIRSIRYLQNVQQAQRLTINREIAVFRALMNDALEYGKRNPTILPLLPGVEVKPSPAKPITTPKPAK